MPKGNLVEVGVWLCGQKPERLREYPHNARTYILGEDSQRFYLQLKSLSPFYLEVITLVNGLDVNHGIPLRPEHRGSFLIGLADEGSFEGYRCRPLDRFPFFFGQKETSNDFSGVLLMEWPASIVVLVYQVKPTSKSELKGVQEGARGYTKICKVMRRVNEKPDEVLVVRYESLTNLLALGIEVERPPISPELQAREEMKSLPKFLRS